MIECGSQIVLCDLPIRLDSYQGCSHACEYCFVKRKYDIKNIKPINSVNSLKGFIKGERTSLTNWCDWNIPLHWGGMSDPFQPCEEQHKISLEYLKILAESKYPFVVSTKGKLLAKDEYLNLLKECNAVVQISMVCSKYDVLEKGCASYEERLEMVRKIAPNCKRVIIRIQPYLTEVLNDVLENLPRLKEAGAYGITIEGMKFLKMKEGLIKVGGDVCYPKPVLKDHFSRIKDACHKLGLKFYCAENRLRAMGDAMTCCGIDGLEDFKGNSFNLCHIYNGECPKPTPAMLKPDTVTPFKGINQNTVFSREAKGKSLFDITCDCVNKKRFKDYFK